MLTLIYEKTKKVDSLFFNYFACKKGGLPQSVETKMFFPNLWSRQYIKLIYRGKHTLSQLELQLWPSLIYCLKVSGQ